MANKFFLCTLFLCLATNASATAASGSRQGFKLGFEVPSLGVYVANPQRTGGSGTETTVTLGGGLQAAYGLSERFVLYVDGTVMGGLSSVHLQLASDQAPLIFDYAVGARFYFKDGNSFFAGPRVGGTAVFEASSGDNSHIDFGPLFGASAGYEWRLSEHFSAAPELRFDYKPINVNGRNWINTFAMGATLNLLWNF